MAQPVAGKGDNDTTALTSAYEDYIEAIYDLASRGGGSVRNVDVAEELGFSKASVARATKNLREEGYIEQEPYGEISLTEKGRAYGERVIARHWALRTFLVDVLGVDADKANEEACAMEHTISQDTMERWIAWMGEQGLRIEPGGLHNN